MFLSVDRLVRFLHLRTRSRERQKPEPMPIDRSVAETWDTSPTNSDNRCARHSLHCASSAPRSTKRVECTRRPSSIGSCTGSIALLTT